MKATGIFTIAAGFVCASLALTTLAEPRGQPDFVPGEIIVKFKTAVGNKGGTGMGKAADPLGAPSVEKLNRRFRVSAVRKVFDLKGKPGLKRALSLMPAKKRPDFSMVYKIEFPKDADVGEALQAYKKDPNVAYAQPNYLRRLAQSSIPDENSDPRYPQQWHLDAIRAPEAWNLLASKGIEPGGSRDVVVAVIDTGVDYTHPDLDDNMWLNSGEFGKTPDVDDDGNGFVDDIYGANVVSDERSESGDPQDDHGHGTHVAAIIAAEANNAEGGVGVAFNVQIMAIKAAQYSGVLASSDISQAIVYAVDKGADVINMSFGGYSKSQLEEDALAVAFGQAVLVAAAGNDAKVNLPCPFGADMYPAAYNWVLGVMASTETGGLARFSNYDCTPHDTHEYELMAPGVDVLSTLPNRQYAAWDGTSMSAPVVSGMACLLRSYFSDKDMYSSRFIMGQIATQGPDAYAGLTQVPQPELSYLQHWLFDDDTELNELNDGDGIVDSGETIDLAIVIRNHWGKADNVEVTLRAWAEGAVQDDPFVTIDIPSVSYGAIGCFNGDDNGLLYDEEGAITGVDHPFRFTVSADCPNDHVIPFLLTMACVNGLDPGDTTDYSFESRFNLIVQRGRELPMIISEDMTLTKDYYWIVPGQTLIEAGATLTVGPGTQVQFGTANPQDPYGEPTTPLIQVEGGLLVQGTHEEPVEIFPCPLLGGNVCVNNLARTELRYARIRNPRFGEQTHEWHPVDTVDHCFFDYVHRQGETWRIACRSISSTILHELPDRLALGTYYSFGLGEVDTVLADSLHIPFGGVERYLSSMGYNLYSLHNSVFLQGARDRPLCWEVRENWARTSNEAAADDSYTNNAFLSRWWDPDVNQWIRFAPSRDVGRDRYYGIANNYWGGASTAMIDAAIYDFNDDFNKGHIVYQPILTDPPETAYPFVVDVAISQGGQNTMAVGPGEAGFTVKFNRDMDMSVQPQVSFGPDVPFTDCTVEPVGDGWQDPRTWVGTFNVTPLTGDGYQLMRIAGPARAADDPWLVIGDDVERFRFEIITSGTEALNLQATGGEGKVDLSWMQDDFDLLAGYNLYRSEAQDGSYARLNRTIIPGEERSYEDRDVYPGKPYYYKFTVLKTDISESGFSNIASATPLDIIAPVIDHMPITEAVAGIPLQIWANVTDNVSVESVTLCYRLRGETEYRSVNMVNAIADRYSATIPGSQVTLDGLDYYIEATDGISTQNSGAASSPHTVMVYTTQLAVTRVHLNQDGGLQLTWTSEPNCTYTVWSSNNLLADKWPQEATIPSQGATTSWTDTTPSGRTKFYRVEKKQ